MGSDGLVGEEWTSPPPVLVEPLRWAIRWGVFLAVVGAFDLWRSSKRDGSTLSESVRYVLQTDTPHGRAHFEGALIAFHKHIVR